jgi:hypothetical protein
MGFSKRERADGSTSKFTKMRSPAKSMTKICGQRAHIRTRGTLHLGSDDKWIICRCNGEAMDGDRSWRSLNFDSFTRELMQSLSIDLHG